MRFVYLRVTALYAALTMVLFLPLLPHFAVAILGGPVAAVDGWQQVWHLWWTEHAIRSGQSPLFTPLLFHPQGVQLALHPLTLSNGLLALPITAMFGATAAYNVVTYASFVLAGLAAFMLATRAGAAPAAAAVAAAVFAFSPYHTAKMFDGQLELVAVQWLGFFVFALLGVLQRWRVFDIVMSAVLLAVIGYTSLYYLLYTALLAPLIVVLWMPWRTGLRTVLRSVALLSVIPLLAVVLLLPLLVPIFADLPAILAASSDDPITSNFLVLRSANLVDVLLPSSLHPLWGETIHAISEHLHPGIAARNFALGYTALVLATVAACGDWRRSWRWLVIAGSALLLALGPQLTVGSIDTGVPLPYRLLLAVPGMNIMHRPGHFVVLTTLALVPLAALGIQVLQRQCRYPQLLLAGISTLLFIEYIPAPMAVQQRDVHPVYATLGAQPGALLVIPEITKGSSSLQRQLEHERPIVGGFLARTPSDPFVEEVPGVRQLRSLQTEPQVAGTPIATLAPLALRAYGITDVVVEWDDLTAGERSAAAAVLDDVLPGVAPYYTDDSISVYGVPNLALRPFVYFGHSWHEAESDGVRSWRWMGASADLVLVNPLPEAQVVTLVLAGTSYLAPRDITLTLGTRPLSVWALNGAEGRERLTLTLLLPPGEQRLTLSAPTSLENGGAGRGALSIALTELVVR